MAPHPDPIRTAGRKIETRRSPQTASRRSAFGRDHITTDTPQKACQRRPPSIILTGRQAYRKQFTAPGTPAGKRPFLEIAEVRDCARVKLNGKELEAHAWQPIVGR